MNTSPSSILFTTEGFAARPDLTTFAENKAAKLLRHSYPSVHLVRICVRRNTPHSGAPFFAARITAEHEGRDHVAHAEAAEPDTAISEVVGKLERALSTSARAHQHQIRHAAAGVGADFEI